MNDRLKGFRFDLLEKIRVEGERLENPISKPDGASDQGPSKITKQNKKKTK